MRKHEVIRLDWRKGSKMTQIQSGFDSIVRDRKFMESHKNPVSRRVLLKVNQITFKIKTGNLCLFLQIYLKTFGITQWKKKVRIAKIRSNSFSFWYKVLSLLEACFDLISGSSLSMKIQIMGGEITENLGFKSPLRKVKIVC